MFLAVAGMGAAGTQRGTGVVRSRRQVWTVNAANGGGEIDVYLGVNGYIWISKHVAGEGPGGAGSEQVALNRLEEMVSSSMYSSQNDEIGLATRREIARLAGCIRVLVEGGVRVDEDNVMKAYESSVELDLELGDDDEDRDKREGRDYLGGDRASRIVAAVLGRA